MGDLDKLSWPVSRLGEALEALARTGDLAPRSVEVPPLHTILHETVLRGSGAGSRQRLGPWVLRPSR